MSPMEVVWPLWIIFLLTMWGLIVWRWMKVNDHVAVTLQSDVTSADIQGVVNFSGVVTDVAGTPQQTSGTLDGTDPTGAVISLPFTSGADGFYSVAWVAALPAGTWSFAANVAGVLSPPLAITGAQRLRVTEESGIVELGVMP